MGARANVGDMEKDPFYKFMAKTYPIHIIGATIAYYALGGLPFLIWGVVSEPLMQTQSNIRQAIYGFDNIPISVICFSRLCGRYGYITSLGSSILHLMCGAHKHGIQGTCLGTIGMLKPPFPCPIFMLQCLLLMF